MALTMAQREEDVREGREINEIEMLFVTLMKTKGLRIDLLEFSRVEQSSEGRLPFALSSVSLGKAMLFGIQEERVPAWFCSGSFFKN